MQKNNVSLEQKRFKRLNEAAITFSNKQIKQLDLLNVLIESFNNKFKTRFYYDVKRNEIVHANLITENSFMHYKKLCSLLDKKGFNTKITESSVPDLNGLSRLMESELAQAEIILAAQSIGDRLQKMAEDLAQMISEDVLPISDQMKSIFGPEMAEKWNVTSKEALESAFSTVSKTKDAISDANLVLEKKLEGENVSPSDMSGSDSMANFKSDADDEQDTDLTDLDADLASGSDDSIDSSLDDLDLDDTPEEPLGRAKKESVNYTKKSLTETEGPTSDEYEASYFDAVLAEHGDYKLLLNVMEDDDNRKNNYYIGKTSRIINGTLYYKIVQILKISPYASRHEAIEKFNEIVPTISENMLSEHDDYKLYVRELEKEGYKIKVHQSAETTVFEVTKNGKTVFIEEPRTGIYQVMAFDEEYSTLKDAVHAYFSVTENEEMIGERNAFAHAVQKAKAAGHDEFELDGKTYKVEESEMNESSYRCGAKHYRVTENTTDLAAKALDTMQAGKKNTPPQRVDPKRERAIKDLDDAMTRNPKLKKTMSDLVGETIREDISMGIKEPVAIRNAAIVHNITLTEAERYWKNNQV